MKMDVFEFLACVESSAKALENVSHVFHLRFCRRVRFRVRKAQINVRKKVQKRDLKSYFVLYVSLAANLANDTQRGSVNFEGRGEKEKHKSWKQEREGRI